MSETVIRIRRTPGGLDDNNDPIQSSVTRVPLKAKAVMPGPTKFNASQARQGETIEHTVYFIPAPDLTNDDELEIRGLVCKVRILDWRSAFGTGRRGLEVLAVTGRG
ncbi:hypothetical protein EU244_033890 [Rhodococcus qingshengii]|uniref:hypothetical protein n=1 Tax=Rhodococcus qingshengii TaxID=334542 RepID=UPI0010A6B3E9|nr:hypothetical protein [Rhodococcus qingshengii]THJ69480.1 hypothetical protein EU244_21200 [Rhodococcus qingshengii]